MQKLSGLLIDLVFFFLMQVILFIKFLLDHQLGISLYTPERLC